MTSIDNCCEQTLNTPVVVASFVDTQPQSMIDNTNKSSNAIIETNNTTVVESTEINNTDTVIQESKKNKSEEDKKECFADIPLFEEPKVLEV